MPKATFHNLTPEKKERVYKASLKEFIRVPFEDVSIKNIVKQAEIPRGSFYQYFEDKEDLLVYILNETKNNIPELDIEKRTETPDLFEYLFQKAKLEIEAVIQQTINYRSYRARLLVNIIKSPAAKNIFHQQIKTNFQRFRLFSNLKNSGKAEHLSDQQMSNLIDLLVYSMSQSIMTVLLDKSRKNQALEDLKIKLDFIKNGVFSL